MLDQWNPAFGQMLEGGYTQLFIDLRLPIHEAATKIADGLPRIPTKWKNFMGLNISEKTVAVQNLTDYERAAKAAAAGGAGSRGARAADSSSRDDQTAPGRSP